jgi:hypothetical protein
MVSLQEEVRTVLTHTMVKWISESATWPSKITVPQGICHLIRRYIAGNLNGMIEKARNDQLVTKVG